MTEHIETVPATTTITPDELDLVSRTIAKDLLRDELRLYLYMCAKEWGVHPLSKMVFPVKYKGKMTFLTSIDYLRARAGQTKEHAGTDDAIFTQAEGLKHPDAATVTAYRMVQGQRCAFTATARWSEYKPTENDWMWLKMPNGQLAKCAEALALRKAFPAETAKLYTWEEMDQAAPAKDVTPATGDNAPGPQPIGRAITPQSGPQPIGRAVGDPPPHNPAPTQVEPGLPRLITEKQVARLRAIAGKAGVSEANIKTQFGLDHVADIAMSRYDAVVSWAERGGK